MSVVCYVEREDSEGTYVEEVNLPTHKEVCDRCNGRGTHTNPAIDGNGITADEWAEWGDDEREGYMTGRYDVRCEECHGANVVDVVSYDELTDELKAAWDAQVQDNHDYRAERAAELRMGA